MTRLTLKSGLKLTLPVILAFFLGAGGPRTLHAAEKQAYGSSSDAAEAHAGKGNELLRDRRYTEAAKEFQTALALEPHLVRVRYQLAVCWFNVGQLKQSREEFERVRRESWGDASVTYYLGRIDLLEGDTESALREFKSIVSAGPFEDTYYYLGLACLNTNQVEDAKLWLRKAAQAQPGNPHIHDHLARVYQKLGQRSEAEKESVLAAQSRQRLEEASRLTDDCGRGLATQPLEEAQTACQKLFDLSDEHSLLTLGVLYGQHGYFERALEPLRRAAQVDPDSEEIQYNLGLSYFRLRRYREARTPLEKAVALQPDFFGPSALLGATLYSLEDELAYPLLQHAHRLNPQHAETAELLFRVSVGLGQKEFLAKKYTRSLTFLKQAAELNPSVPDVHRLLAEVYHSLGQAEDAARENTEAERLQGAKNQ